VNGDGFKYKMKDKLVSWLDILIMIIYYSIHQPSK